MQTTTTPTKRHHSQISMPRRSNSDSAAYTNTSHNTNTNTSHGNNHPFEHLIQLFHRPKHHHHPPTEHHQQQHQQDHQQQQQPCEQMESHHLRILQQQQEARRLKLHQAQHQQQATMATSSSHSQYVAPTVHTAPIKPKIQPVSTSTSNSTSATAVSSWRTAICPRTQKPYYWNVHTRESRWKKPLELASTEERVAIETKERELKSFFEEMERNIMNRSKKKLDNNGVGGRKHSPPPGEGGAMLLDGGSPGNGGIDQSWMQPTNDTAISPNDNHNSFSNSANDNLNADWISGWITPGSSSPTGSLSLSSMDGLSDSMIDTPGSTTGSLGSTSLGSLSREERDDKLYPLHHNNNQRPSKIERIKSASKKPVIDKPDLIRTISKMEYELVCQLNPSLMKEQQQQQQQQQAGTPRTGGAKDIMVNAYQQVLEEPTTPTTQTCDILSSLRLTLGADGLDVTLDSPNSTDGALATVPITPSSLDYDGPTSPMTPEENLMSSSRTSSTDNEVPSRSFSASTGREGVSTKPQRPNLVTKRNTCGTIYLGSTLSAPDKDALIKCVCGVFRAHLLQGENSTVTSYDPSSSSEVAAKNHQIFNDRRSPGDYRHLDTTSIPTLSQITDFYRSIFLRSQMEVDCIIISLIYVERLIKLTQASLAPHPNNWRSILFSCMVLSSKVWDDLSMWNCDFSKIGPGGMTFSLSRTNELEIALLRALEYKVKVNAGEYAKYYFLLRGMLCRSGLANDDLTRLRPLDVKSAEGLEGTNARGIIEEKRSSIIVAPTVTTSRKKKALKERSKSYGHAGEMTASKSGGSGSPGSSSADDSVATSPSQQSPAMKRASLEQIVRMQM